MAGRSAQKRAPRRPPKRPPKFTPKPKNLDIYFTFFSRLPTEIRLAIWRHAFPGPRNVRFDLGLLSTPHPRLPITLSINRESRHETLLHYRVIHPTDVLTFTSNQGFPRTPFPPFVFAPARDAVYVRNWYGRSRDAKALEVWLAHVAAGMSSSSLGLSAVRRMLILELEPDEVPRSPGWEVTGAMFAVGLVLRFEGLEELRVDGIRPEEKNRVQERLEGFLRARQRLFEGGKVPRLICTCG